jgi:subtilisin family serine protease
MGVASLNRNNLQVTTFQDSSAATAHASGVAAIQLEQSGLLPVALEARVKQLATPNTLTYPGNATWFTTTGTPNLLLYSLSY